MRWLVAMAALASFGTAVGQGLALRSVDPLTKVFRDDADPPVVKAPIDVARGEQAEWQIVLRADAEATQIKVSVGSPRRLGGAGGLPRPRVRFVGYVPVDRGMAQPSQDRLRVPPADFPDPLLTQAPTTLAAQVNLPIWVDLAVPSSAAPGVYSTELKLAAKVGGQELVCKIPIQARVHDVTVGKSRLWVTNWFFTGTGHMPGSNSPGSKEELAYLRQLAQAMASHRQNVALVNTLELASFAWDERGKLTVDFSRFDEWVGILLRAGVAQRIEGGHMGGRSGEPWESPFVVHIKAPEGGKVVTKAVDPRSPEAERFYSQYLPQLVRHLKQRRWWDRYLQHLGDEPYERNLESYKAMAELVRKHAPGIGVIEATHTKELEGSVDVWVPQLNVAHTDYDYFRSRQKAGDEFWMYTCVWPEGEYANRFIELPLIKTRLLHWINFRYGITGYLHWGFNYWVQGDPFDDVTRTKANDGWGGFLPAGDSWIVYPKDGKLLDSIRFEAMRDGIADYELLCMLSEKDAPAAERLASRIVLAFDRYQTDVSAFRAVRSELLEKLARKR